MTDKAKPIDRHLEQEYRSEPAAKSPLLEQASNQEKFEALGDVAPIEAEKSNIDTLVQSIEYSSEDAHAPNAPEFRGKRDSTRLKDVHVLGDLHGWAPGLITYLITHKLATIRINGMLLGSEGLVDERAMNNLFARDSSMSSSALPSAGLLGRPLYDECVNGTGHYNVFVRWTGLESTGFVQLGDVVDRSDHSELACEILRQLLIDAPGNVFVLLGNHEQFLLENEYDNWHLNEVRNAVIDGRHAPKKWAKKHLRFLGTREQDEVARSKSIFKAYKDSAELLYLTQAAAQQVGLGFDHNLEDSDIALLLSNGWKPYQSIQSLSKKYSQKGVAFPGAFTSLVIGETLFHHAEPSQQMSSLASEMNWEKQLGWLSYIHGGNNLQNSPHSYLLWSRGASTGAESNRPASQDAIEQISIHWPGLYNIVHGHTPTVTLSEFEHVSGGRSTPVSYLAENSNSTPKFGKASRVRIYNIDEGMAPVYYNGKENPDDPLRVPVGLRLENKNQRSESVIAHTTSDRIFEVEKNRTVRADTRKLWRWQRGTTRTNSDSSWKETSNERWQKTISEQGITYLIEVSSYGKALLSRSISGYSILSNVLTYLLDDAKMKPKQLSRTPPNKALKHVHVDDGERDLSHMLHLGQSWKTAKKIALTAIGIQSGQRPNTSEIFAINSSKNGRSFFLHHQGLEAQKTKLISYSIHQFILEHGNEPFCISFSPKDKLKGKLNNWLGEVSFNSKTDAKIPMCIGLFPLESNQVKIAHSKIATHGIRKWDYPIKVNKPLGTSLNKPLGKKMEPLSEREDVRRPVTPDVSDNSTPHLPKQSVQKDIRDRSQHKSPPPSRQSPASPLRKDVRDLEPITSKDIRDTPSAKITPQQVQSTPTSVSPPETKATTLVRERVTSKPSSTIEPKHEKKKPATGSEKSSGSSRNEPTPQNSNQPVGRIGSIRTGNEGELIITINPEDLKRFFKKKTRTDFKAKVEISFNAKWVHIDIRATHTTVKDAPFIFQTKRIALIESRDIQGKPNVKGKRHGITSAFLLELLKSDSINSMLVACKEGWPNAPDW